MLAQIPPIDLRPACHRFHVGCVGAEALIHDFVVCRASDLSVVCAIELNDKSHASEQAQDRDAIKRNVCKAINLPLLEVVAKRSYSVPELQEQLASAIGVAPADASVAK